MNKNPEPLIELDGEQREQIKASLPSKDTLIVDSMLRAGVPRSMARPDFSMAQEFGKPGEYLAGWGKKARAFFAEGRVLFIGAEREADMLASGRMLYGLARSLILNRNSCRVVPLATIAGALTRDSEAALLGELEDMDALLLPDFLSENRPAPFDQGTMSRLEGWLYHQLCRKGQGFVLVAETADFSQCSKWWSRWFLSAMQERMESFIVTKSGRDFDLR